MNAWQISIRLGLCAMVTLAGCAPGDEDERLLGYVEAEWVYVSAPASGWPESQSATLGARVETGDVLFELDRTEQQAALAETSARTAQAEAQVRDAAVGARPEELRELGARLQEARAILVQAESEQQRVLPLVEQGIEARSRGEQVIANYQAARASVAAAQEAINVANLAAREGVLEAARAARGSASAAQASAQWRLSERTVRARAAGRVEEVFHYPGEYVVSGTPVMALLPEDGLKVHFFVAQARLPELHLGGAVLVRADGIDEPVTATVSFIAADPEFTPPVIYSERARDKLVFLVQARLPAASPVHPGLPVEVSWL